MRGLRIIAHDCDKMYTTPLANCNAADEYLISMIEDYRRFWDTVSFSSASTNKELINLIANHKKLLKYHWIAHAY